MRVPTYKSQTQRTAEIGGQRFTVQASPAASSAALGALGNLAETATNIAFDYAEKKVRAQNNADINRIQNDIDEDVSQALILAADQPLEEREAFFTKELARISNGHISGVSRDVVKRSALAHFDNRKTSSLINLRKQIDLDYADKAQAELYRRIEVLGKQAANVRDRLASTQATNDLLGENNIIRQAVLDGIFTEVEGFRIESNARREVARNTAFAMVESLPPSQAMAYIEDFAKNPPLGVDKEEAASIAKTLGIEVRQKQAAFASAANKQQKAQQEEAEALIVNTAMTQDRPDTFAYNVQMGLPTGVEQVDKYLANMSLEDRADLADDIRDNRKDNLLAEEREQEIFNQKRKEAIKEFDVKFLELEANSAPYEEFVRLIEEAEKVDRVYAAEKKIEYIRPEGGLRMLRPPPETTDAGNDFLTLKRMRGNYSFEDLNSYAFRTQLSVDDKRQYTNDVIAAEQKEIKDAVAYARAELDLPAGFENSKFSEQSSYYERSQIISRVQNRLNNEFTRARAKGEDFDAIAVADQLLREEQEKIKVIVTEVFKESADKALAQAQEYAKKQGIPVPENYRDGLATVVILQGLIDSNSAETSVQKQQGRLSGMASNLERMINRAD